MNEDIDDEQLHHAVVVQNDNIDDNIDEAELRQYVNPEDEWTVEWTVDKRYGWGCDDPPIGREQPSIHEQLSIDMVDSLLDEGDAAINTPLTRSQKKRRSRRLRCDLRREDLRREDLRLAPPACVCFPFSLTVSFMQVNQEHHVQVMQRLYRCVFGALQQEFPEAIVGLSPTVAFMHF